MSAKPMYDCRVENKTKRTFETVSMELIVKEVDH